VAWQVPHVTNSTPAAYEFAIGPEGSIWLAENARKLRWWNSLPPSSAEAAGTAISCASVQMGCCPMQRWDALATSGKTVVLDSRACYE
jgi:hypothetical protein